MWPTSARLPERPGVGYPREGTFRVGNDWRPPGSEGGPISHAIRREAPAPMPCLESPMRTTAPLHPAPPRLLLLDAGGLLVSNQMLVLFHDLAREAGTTVHRVRVHYQRHRSALWSGRMDEASFWRELLDGLGLEGDITAWQRRMAQLLGPQLAPSTLTRWSAQLPVWVVSNHRSEWLVPALERHGLVGHLDRLLISDVLGIAKPEMGLYGLVESRAQLDPQQLLFVDDRPRNLRPARRRGWRTLRADPHGRWIGTIDRLLAPPPGDHTTEPPRRRAGQMQATELAADAIVS